MKVSNFLIAFGLLVAVSGIILRWAFGSGAYIGVMVGGAIISLIGFMGYENAGRDV